ncbi:MAG: ParB/RepB/Spo0J family partition protein [Chthoniobacteraceae bacterium]
MKEIDYDQLTPAQQDSLLTAAHPPAANEFADALFALDDDEQLIGYRRPNTFKSGTPIKWDKEVISLETGGPIPLIGQPEKPRAKKKAVAAASGVNGDGAGETQWIAIHDIAVTSNVRTSFPEAEMIEMRANFTQRGFMPEISRLLVRPGGPLGMPFELVLGGRRYRAACDTGISPVPCVVREMSDAEMLELQLVENVQRKGLTVMDEAEGICRLLELRDDAGALVHTAKTLAERLDCSPTHISECRSLRRLRGTPAGEAIDRGELSSKHGVQLAKVADRAKRDELTHRVLRTSDGRGALPAEVLATWIKDEVMIQLRALEFDPEDETLVAVKHDEAGARTMGGKCSDCPFNTKNAEDDDGRDARAVPMCTHPHCFREKLAASEHAWVREMAAKGLHPLERERAARLLDHTGERLAPSSGHVELDERPAEWVLREGTKRVGTWKTLIKGQGVPVTVFKDAKGNAHEVVSYELAVRAAVANGHDIFRKAETEQEKTTEAQAGAPPADNAVDRAAEQLQREREAEEREAKQEREDYRAGKIAEAEFNAVVAGAHGTKVAEGFWERACDPLIRLLDEQGDTTHVAERHGFDGDGDQAGEWLRKKIAKLEAPFRMAMLVELLLALYVKEEADAELPKWAKVFGVDLKKVRKETEKGLDAEEAANDEQMEIANGVSWSSEKKGVEFEWEGNLATNPDVAALAIPSGKFNVFVGVAQGVKGWVVGWQIAETKKKHRTLGEPCALGTAHYSNRTLAFRTGLLAVRAALGELGAPPQDIARVEAYIAAVEVPADKSKPKKKPAKGAKPAKKKGAKK